MSLARLWRTYRPGHPLLLTAYLTLVAVASFLWATRRGDLSGDGGILLWPMLMLHELLGRGLDWAATSLMGLLYAAFIFSPLLILAFFERLVASGRGKLLIACLAGCHFAFWTLVSLSLVAHPIMKVERRIKGDVPAEPVSTARDRVSSHGPDRKLEESR